MKEYLTQGSIMKLLLNDNVYGYKMTGFIGKGGRWFFGLSIPIKKGEKGHFDDQWGIIEWKDNDNNNIKLTVDDQDWL